MKVRVNNIDPSGRHEVAELPIDGLPLLMDVIRSEGLSFAAAVSVDIVLMRQGEDTVMVTGTIDTRVSMNCGRCLEPTTEDVHVDIGVVFERAAADAAAAIGDVVALTDEGMDRVLYDGDLLDLDITVQEEVIAALPFRPLCREDCKGLCPGCGANLNTAACCCEKTSVDPRLAALKNWRTE